MNKSILMSIRPQYVAKILDGEKTIEVRKKFPKNYVGWVYIYCTKDTKNCLFNKNFNGKVVARFWCDKVEEIEHYPYEAPEHPRGYQIAYDTQTTDWDKLCEMSCLSRDKLFDYFGRNNGYAIHISKLEVFDKPWLLSMFRKPEYKYFLNDSKANRMSLLETLTKYSIIKAPQSWRYVL